MCCLKLKNGDLKMGIFKNVFSVSQGDHVVLSEPLLKLGGYTGLLKLYDDRVVIDRSEGKSPLSAKRSKRENVILLNDVMEIHLNVATWYLNGYIRFVLKGGDGSSLSFKEASVDENLVIITRNNNDFMFRFVDKILELNSAILVFEKGGKPESNGETITNKMLKTVSLGIAHVGEEMLKSKTGVRYKGTMAQREMFSNIKSSSTSVPSSQYPARKENQVYESVNVGNNTDVDKGDMFEQHVVDLFNKSHFNVVEWTTDMMRKHNRYVESDSNPDLTMRHKTTDMVFSVECKFRSNLYKGALSWSNWKQLRRYKLYSSDNEIPLFVVIGLGGNPQYPDRMFCIPIDEIQYSALYPKVFEKYEREPDKMFFCDGVFLK